MQVAHLLIAGAALSGLKASLAQNAAPCVPSWHGGYDIMVDDGIPVCLKVFDSGNGPRLYVGGEWMVVPPLFTYVGIAYWDGTFWRMVGSGGPTTPVIAALAVFDVRSGSGPNLYVGGSFPSVRNQQGISPALNIAKWDGTMWSAVGGGLNGYVGALEVYDDGSGSGPQLYAGGRFSLSDNTPLANIAKWNGSTWSDVGGGIHGNSQSTVHALASVHHPVSGKQVLAAGGDFQSAGGVSTYNIAIWDGRSWMPTWSPFYWGVDDTVYAITEYTHPGAERNVIVAGGDFQHASIYFATRVAEWNGLDWAPLHDSLSDTVHTLEIYDDGSGSRLYVGGWWGVGAIRFDGQQWEQVGSIQSIVLDFEPFLEECSSAGTSLIGVGANAFGHAFRWGCPNTLCVADVWPPGGDDTVDVYDLLTVIGNWDCVERCQCDANCDGTVNIHDLLVVIADWGPCT